MMYLIQRWRQSGINNQNMNIISAIDNGHAIAIDNGHVIAEAYLGMRSMLYSLAFPSAGGAAPPPNFLQKSVKLRLAPERTSQLQDGTA
jgi:hypothetical protein